jgi:PPM family protein phosphatase
LQTCPRCLSPVADNDRFCGECGAALAPAEAPDPHDHAELVISPDFAGATDRGRRHAHNEDALLIAETQTPKGLLRLLVVSDGVSSSVDAARASRVAVETMRHAVLEAAQAGADLRAALSAGVAAAQAAVCALPAPDEDFAPAATLVAAALRGSEGLLAWAGDSRAYLLAPTPELLTRDDSWLNEVVAAGRFSKEEAERHRMAHAITRCLGQTSAYDEPFAAHIEAFAPPPAGMLALCSDGLWNYAETAEEIARLVPEGAPDAAAICRAMIDFANARGGMDNISVALLRWA